MPKNQSFSKANAAVAYLWVTVGPVVGTYVLSPFREWVDLSNVALLYVLVVVIAAVRFERGPAVAAALMGSLCFAYVFVPPHFSLAITEAQYLLTAVIMLVVALMVSHLTSRLKHHADFVERKSVEGAKLYTLAQNLAGALTFEEVTQSAGDFLAATIDARNIHVVVPKEFECVSESVRTSLVRQCAQDRAFLSCPSANGRFSAYVPLNAASGIQGVLVFETASANLGSESAIESIETAASVIAVALERSHFAAKASETEVKHAAESLRSSILSALSHDLRTPLTALVGMTETVAHGKVSPERQKHLLEAIRNQALSISQQMTKLLDMAGLSSGRIAINAAWQPVEEVLGATLEQIRAQWKDREITVDLGPDLPPIKIDAVLMERVLWNLLENAIKYSPADMPIEVAAKQRGREVEVSVCDAGPGLPPLSIEKIFDRFQRGRSESDIPGVGLGLSIAKSIVEAHGGVITAQNRSGGGSCFLIRLPMGEPPDFALMETVC